MIYKFYDTCSLLLKANNLFTDENEKVIISSITFQELEDIKTSRHKDESIKAEARQLVRLLENNIGKYEIYLYTEDMLEDILRIAEFQITNDLKILASAFSYDKKVHPDETVFITNDLVLKNIAHLFFGEDSIESVGDEDTDTYTGYLEVEMSDQAMSDFYSNLDYNTYDLYINEYIIIKNTNGEVVDQLRWDGETHQSIATKPFKSIQFGTIKPMKNDVYQLVACDSLSNNQITLLKGPAGSGKSLIALGYLFSLLERNKIDKIIIFCNTIATRGAAKLGYYPGDRNQKLLDSQIGNFLSSKLGDSYEVEKLINNGKIVLVPLADARGYDTTGMNAGVYITEAQNMSIDLMKLMLQRIGEDSVCVIDGDDNTQVDSIEFMGANNGMKRASKVFRGNDFYGEVELKNIYRSRIAQVAEQM